MVKVLIYSSKEIYDTASYVGRAEAHIIAYRKPDNCYQIVKNRSGRNLGSYTTFQGLQLELKWIERDELDQELKNYKNFYKNAGVAQG
jgi:hypothetical protein